MNKKQKFEKFLESLKGNGQDVLIESLKQGFQVCFENEVNFQKGESLQKGELYKYYPEPNSMKNEAGEPIYYVVRYVEPVYTDEGGYRDILDYTGESNDPDANKDGDIRGETWVSITHQSKFEKLSP